MKTVPTQQSERIVSLDVLRGFSILGILVMNMQSFATIGSAYYNPTIYGNFEELNKIIWIFQHTFFELKFVTLFSILFGAGVILFTNRLEAKGYTSIKIHYRRMFWLLVFGLAHAYLIFFGDILVAYAISGMYVVLMRNWKPKKLLIAGFGFFLVNSIVFIIIGLVIPHLSDANIASIKDTFEPGAELIQKEIAAFRGGWIEQLPMRAEFALTYELFIFLQTGWMAGGLMLMGMALYKWGILSAEKSFRFYLRLTIYSLIPGLLIVGWETKMLLDTNFHFPESFFINSQLNYWGTLLVSLGYIGLIMLMVKSNIFNLLKKSLQAVGQMAFTNYLMQSIICTTIFYGHGFGLFGKVERAEQMIYVFVIFLIQMIYSPIWLSYFKYGPFEWAWRSLTYWKIQPIKR